MVLAVVSRGGQDWKSQHWRVWAFVFCASVVVNACTEDGVEPGGALDPPPTNTDGGGLRDAPLIETGPPPGLPDVGSDIAPDVGSGGGGNDAGPPPRVDGGDAGEPPTIDAGSVPPLDPECDLRGRWIVSQRYVAEALSERQGQHGWFYLEIRQEGANVTVQKGLHCGYTVTPITALGGKVDCAAAWPSFLAKNSSSGRRGTFVKNGSTCKLKLDREFTPRGVTLPHYNDPNNPLPMASQPAQGNTPGWEDWDGDGNPGVTLTVSGLASGKIYTAQRERTAYDGDVPLSATKFKVPILVGFENVVLGRMGPALLESPSQVSADASQHYAWLARLADDQAVGSDAERCAAIRALKGQLVPEGDM
jgi:hypothetical protein